MTTIYIIGYIIAWILTYYYCRWTIIKTFGRNSWDWIDICFYIVLSLFTIFTAFIQTCVYLPHITSFKLKDPPKWL